MTPIQSTPRNSKSIKCNKDGQSSALVPTTPGALMTPQRKIRQHLHGQIVIEETVITTVSTKTIHFTHQLDPISISDDGVYLHHIYNRMVYELQLTVDECIQLFQLLYLLLLYFL